MTERTPEEIQALLRQLKRDERDQKIRAGRVAPRTYRETEMWRADVAERFGLDDPSTTAAERRETPHPPTDTAEPAPTRRRRQEQAAAKLDERLDRRTTPKGPST